MQFNFERYLPKYPENEVNAWMIDLKVLFGPSALAYFGTDAFYKGTLIYFAFYLLEMTRSRNTSFKLYGFK